MSFLELLEQIQWLPTLKIHLIDIVQILILAGTIYFLTKSMYKTRAWILVKGLAIIGAIYLFICLTNMKALQLIMQSLFSTLMISIVVMLQPELQKIVELIGKRKFSDVRSIIFKKIDMPSWYSDKTIQEIANACEVMSEAKTGALIVIERGVPLTDCVNSGINLGSAVSSQLLINIFEKKTPLLDGAVIISNDRVESATSYLPLSTNLSIDKNLGTRHRAAIGVSESSDCIVVVVSEETGAISFCKDGAINHSISKNELIKLLTGSMQKNDDRVVKSETKTPMWIKTIAPILSTIIWMSVISANDPITTKIIQDIPVATINTEVLDGEGHAFSITDGNFVTIQAKGRRSIIDNLTANDFYAFADFEEMSMVYSVPIKIETASDKDVEVSIRGESVMKLEIEAIVKIDIPIVVDIVGDNNNDYVVRQQNNDAGFLSVSCPQSLAKTLDKAVVTVDATGKENPFVSTLTPIIYDKNGNIVPSKQITLSQEAIGVHMDVYEVREIPIVVKLADQDLNADSYYELKGYEADHTFIRVAADNDIMDTLKEIEILVNPSENMESTSSVLFNIHQAIPDNVFLAKDQSEHISIELDLTKYQKRILQLATHQIKIVGYDAELLDVTIIEAPKSIVLYYNTSTVDSQTITLDVLKPTIKVQETKCGEYVTKISITDIDGVAVISDLSAQYELAEKERG